MGLSCFRVISGYGMDGWNLCAGLFYEHRFAVLINTELSTITMDSNESGMNGNGYFLCVQA